jgi:hypothetical protein
MTWYKRAANFSFEKQANDLPLCLGQMGHMSLQQGECVLCNLLRGWHSAPWVTILSFNRMPSNKTLFSAKKKTFDQTFWATSRVLSMPWLASRRISGSTMGTKPLSCMLLKLAREMYTD